MRLPLALASLAIACAPAAAEEIISGFVGDSVTVYDAANTDDGWAVPSCAIAVPALVRETSPYLRVQIDSPDGLVWVSTRDAVTEEVDELPDLPRVTRDDLTQAGGTRDPNQSAGLTAPVLGRSLVVPADDASSEGALSDPQAGLGDIAASDCDYQPRAARDENASDALVDADARDDEANASPANAPD